MKRIFIGLFGLFLSSSLLAQKADKIESIYFHLYTDSLKKGQHNYINVDGKLESGKWKPLSSKDILFTSTYGSMEGNELFIPEKATEEKVTIKASLKSNPAVLIEKTIWIKVLPDPDLPKKAY